MDFTLFVVRYPNELLECLRLLCLRPSDLIRGSDGAKVPLAAVRLNQPISDDNEIEVLEAIVAACRVSLKRFVLHLRLKNSTVNAHVLTPADTQRRRRKTQN